MRTRLSAFTLLETLAALLILALLIAQTALWWRDTAALRAAEPDPGLDRVEINRCIDKALTQWRDTDPRADVEMLLHTHLVESLGSAHGISMHTLRATGNDPAAGRWLWIAVNDTDFMRWIPSDAAPVASGGSP